MAGMTRLELANQLIENQSAFHFAFIPVIVWCAWRDSNSQKAGLKSAASSNWATRACRFRIANCGLRICVLLILNPKSAFRDPQSLLVPAEGFEPTLSSS